MSSVLHITGAMEKSTNCPNCYVDVETKKIVSPCREHKHLYFTPVVKKKHPKPKQLDLGLK